MPIKVMLSSRCLDPIASSGGEVLLSKVRQQVKADIESWLVVGGKRTFDVWITEDAPGGPGDEDAWTTCMTIARECDIFICLFNGHSGWSLQGHTIGICEAELVTAMESGGSKVRCIEISPPRARSKPPEADWDRSFKEYVQRLNPLLAKAKDDRSLKLQIKKTLQDTLLRMALQGARALRSGRGYLGQALDWNRMNFSERKKHMESELVAALLSRPDARRIDDQTALVPVAGSRVVIRCAGIPASMSVPAAREMVGQPFLRDYELLTSGPGKPASGPVHVIGCQKSVTEAQARQLLGFPDATVVSTPYGIWVADPIQKIQLLFVSGCVDAAATRLRLQSCFDWMEQTGEASLLAQRASSRARIVKVIAAEMP
jgi:hypothetical protein